MVTVIDTNPLPAAEPVSLKLNLDTTLPITADEARRRVNCDIVTELGTGLVACQPELVIADKQISWRVSLLLSLPEMGELGKVGDIEIDARSGDILTAPDVQAKIIKHASLLFNGATALPAE